MNDKTVAVLQEVAEFLEDQSDVVDGSYGVPHPNRAMNLLREVEECISSVKSETGQGWKPGEPRVVCAAIRDKLGRIITGARHYDALMVAQIRRSVADQDSFRTAEQGFIDQHGNFLTREEAMVIALRWGQIIRDDEGRQSLYSENLY